MGRGGKAILAISDRMPYDSSDLGASGMIQRTTRCKIPLVHSLWMLLLVLLSTNERIMAQGNWRDRENDAYSTATALLILTQSEDYEKFEFVFDKLWFRYGIRYLLNTQKPDGSWHVSSRANPVQEFFDNGDPHDTDQFISIQATAWAVAALACDQHRINDPLGLPLSPVNTGRGYYDRKTATP